MADEFAFKRVTAPDIAKRKGGSPIVVLTAYHAHTARIIDPHVDMLLVGDLLGMVMHGYETTVPVPLELMIMHAQAVVRGSSAHSWSWTCRSAPMRRALPSRSAAPRG